MTNLISKETETHGENVYTYHRATTGVKTEWAVTVCTGARPYVNVRKVTANPYGIVGKDFKNFDEARANYKNAELKAVLTQIEFFA